MKTILLLLLSVTPAQAQDVQQACTPDVMRLCMQAVNEGPPAIIACLTRNKANVSPECHAAYLAEKKAKRK